METGKIEYAPDYKSKKKGVMYSPQTGGAYADVSEVIKSELARISTATESEHRQLKDAVLEAARVDRASETRKLESNADLDVMVQSRRAFRLAVTALLEFERHLPAPSHEDAP